MKQMYMAVPPACGELSAATSLVEMDMNWLHMKLLGTSQESKDEVRLYAQLQDIETLSWDQYAVRTAGASALTISVSGEAATAHAIAAIGSKKPAVAVGQWWKFATGAEDVISSVGSEHVYFSGGACPLVTYLQNDPRWSCIGIETPRGRVMVGERRIYLYDGEREPRPNAGVWTVEGIADQCVSVGHGTGPKYKYAATDVARWPLEPKAKRPQPAANQVWRYGATDRVVSHMAGENTHFTDGTWAFTRSDNWSCVGIHLPDGREMLVGETWEYYGGAVVGWTKRLLDEVTELPNVGPAFGNNALHSVRFSDVLDRNERWRKAKKAQPEMAGKQWIERPQIQPVFSRDTPRQNWKTRKPTPAAGQVWKSTGRYMNGEPAPYKERISKIEDGWITWLGKEQGGRDHVKTLANSFWSCVGIETPAGTVHVGDVYQVSEAATCAILGIVERDEVGLGVEIQYEIRYKASSGGETFYCGPANWSHTNKVTPPVAYTPAVPAHWLANTSVDHMNALKQLLTDRAQGALRSEQQGYIPPKPIDDGWQVTSFKFGTLDCKDMHTAIPIDGSLAAVGGLPIGMDTKSITYKPAENCSVKAPQSAHDEQRAKAESRAQFCRQVDELLAKDAAKTPRFAKARKYAVMAKMESVDPAYMASIAEVAIGLCHKYQMLLDKGWRPERAAEETKWGGASPLTLEAYERGKKL